MSDTEAKAFDVTVALREFFAQLPTRYTVPSSESGQIATSLPLRLQLFRRRESDEFKNITKDVEIENDCTLVIEHMFQASVSSQAAKLHRDRAWMAARVTHLASGKSIDVENKYPKQF